MYERNWSRLLLAFQALVVGVGGASVWVFPEEACTRMAGMRALVADAITCPRYLGEHAVFEMYNFSLGKHHAMLGLLFASFAIFGRSREVINLGFAYFAIAMALDSVPVFTWLSPMVSAPLPAIGRAGLVFVAISALGIYWNSRHSEWSATQEAQ